MSRFLSSLALGILVAIGLFLVMNSLIQGGGDFRAQADEGAMVDFVRVERETQEQLKERRIPQKPPPPQEPPPPPQLEVQNQDRPPQQRVDMITPAINATLGDGAGPFLGGFGQGQAAAEGDAIPIVRIAPQYPREAAMRGLEGWVDFEFTIEPDGSVSDPIAVDYSDRQFVRPAMRAILRWKFKPRVVDGRPVPRQARQRIDFSMEAEEGG